MALNEGEQVALLNQVTVIVGATEDRLRKLGLKNAKVVLFDENSKSPMTADSIVAMANGQ